MSVCLTVGDYLLTIFFDFFSRTTGIILIKLCMKHPCVERIEVCLNEGPWPPTRGDN